MTNITPRKGDIIEYRPFGGGVRRVRVEGHYDDIKNGRPGFDGELAGVKQEEPFIGVWGYDDQIIRIVSRAATIEVVGPIAEIES